jgi:hypothetical protein
MLEYMLVACSRSVSAETWLLFKRACKRLRHRERPSQFPLGFRAGQKELGVGGDGRAEHLAEGCVL